MGLQRATAGQHDGIIERRTDEYDLWDIWITELVAIFHDCKPRVLYDLEGCNRYYSFPGHHCSS
jgi:hypothetical protein